MLTPFGLFGKLANRGFRERLTERYCAPDIQGDANSMDVEAGRSIHGAARGQEGIDMTQFLLDYVLDMGPALNHPTRLESPGTEGLSGSNLETDGLPLNQGTHNRHTNDPTE